MANVGKCLLFYLKYPAEMERLYEADEPNVEGLPDPDRNLERIRLVGDIALREAAELLEACAQGIEALIRPICTIERVRNNVEKTWELRYRMAASDDTGKRFEIGVLIRVDRQAVIPFVWCRGGRSAEDAVVGILRQPAKLAKPSDMAAGCVMLAEIPIPFPERFDEPIPREPLIAQVHQAFTSFTQDEVKAIAVIANRRGER
jgi:hypothetical protein